MMFYRYGGGSSAGDEQISFFDLVDYFLALDPLTDEEVKEEAALQINRLGLLPDLVDVSTTLVRSSSGHGSRRTGRWH